jgi:hypothetical protein
MTALLRANILCVVVLLLYPALPRADTALDDNSLYSLMITGGARVDDDSPARFEEMGRKLRQDFLNSYEDLKAQQRGIFNENISAIVERYLTVEQTFEDADAILQAAGSERLKKFRFQQSDTEEMYVSNLVLLKGLVESITVNIRVYFRRSNRGLTLNHVDAAMMANYL